MKLLFILMYFLNFFSAKMTYLSYDLYEDEMIVSCSEVCEELLCKWYGIDDIKINVDSTKASKQLIHVSDLDDRLKYSQDRLLIEIKDQIKPEIVLKENYASIKDGFDPFDVVESIYDDSEYEYQTYLQDNVVTVVVNDIYQNIAIASTEVHFIDSEEHKVLEYLGDDLGETITNYLSAKNINTQNIGIAVKDLKTNEYYTHNADQLFVAGSSMKLPLSVVIYDNINKGKYSGSTKLLYKESHYTTGTTVVPLYYSFGDYISLSTLLQFTLVPSDNIAANVLFDLLSRTGSIQKQIAGYFGGDDTDVLVTSGNKITPNFMVGVLDELLDEELATKDKYKELVGHITAAYNGRYLKRNLSGVTIAHKCGFYNGNINDSGIIYVDNKPRYLISIYTQGFGNKDKQGVTYAERYIAELNQIVYDYFELYDLGLIRD